MNTIATTSTVTLTAEEYVVLQEMAEVAINLNRHLIPNINYGASAIPGEGIAALNEFSRTIHILEKMLKSKNQ